MTVRGTTFTLVVVRLSRFFLRKLPIRLKVDFDRNSCSKVFFEFPPTVTWNVVIFTYVVADILLYPKSLGSAQTVEYSRRTSCCNKFCIYAQRLLSQPSIMLWTDLCTLTLGGDPHFVFSAKLGFFDVVVCFAYHIRLPQGSLC